MTRPLTRPCLTVLLIACGAATSGCVHLFPRSAPKLAPPQAADPGTPPRIEIPDDLKRAARLAVLPVDHKPTLIDLEAVARDRGAELAVSETRRAAAVALHETEHDLVDRWLAERKRRNRPWWKLW